MSMETLLHAAAHKTLSAAERKALDEKAEREFDLAFLARQKKRRGPVPKGIPWEKVKKDLGL